jgi:hypothetical protein
MGATASTCLLRKAGPRLPWSSTGGAALRNLRIRAPRLRLSMPVTTEGRQRTPAVRPHPTQAASRRPSTRVHHRPRLRRGPRSTPTISRPARPGTAEAFATARLLPHPAPTAGYPRRAKSAEPHLPSSIHPARTSLGSVATCLRAGRPLNPRQRPTWKPGLRPGHLTTRRIPYLLQCAPPPSSRSARRQPPLR